MYELGAEAEKPGKAHKGDQAQGYFKDGLLILNGRFHSGCLLSGTVDGPYGMGKRSNVVQKNRGNGNSKNNDFAIATDEPASVFIAISDKHHLEMIKKNASNYKQPR